MFCFVLVLAVPVSAQTLPAGKRPNILFVLIDDMGYRDLSCFGGTRAQTPEIDRLAREGIRFEQFYVNSPICSPSRTAFTTGQYPNRWRITSYLDNRRMNKQRGMADWLAPEAPTLPRILHDAGYYTAHVGKWHMGGQRDVGDAPAISTYGFDTSITNFEGLGPRILPKFAPNADGSAYRHVPTDMSAALGGEITWIDRPKVSEAFVDRAIAEMKIAQKQGKPFYINLWPDDVHSPCQAPEELRGDGSPAANYVGVLRELDKQLGRAFSYIRENSELRDNTLILLCSDNGHEPGLGTAGELRGAKGQLYEGGIRSPLIAWSPGLIEKSASPGVNDRTVLAAMDIAPSALALVGVSAPKSVAFDGQDMSSPLCGRSTPAREQPIMWVRPPDRPGPKGQWPDLAIRDGDWKLLIARDGQRAELFDVMADPNEAHNLAGKRPELVRELTRKVLDWERSCLTP